MALAGKSRAASQTLLGGLCILGSLSIAQPVRADEYGFSLYPLGASIPMEGYVPPPGVYFSDTIAFYKGSASGNVDLGRNIGVGARVNIAAEIGSLLWMTDAKILGGSLGFAFASGYGAEKTCANAEFTGPLGVNRQPGLCQSSTGTADSSVTALLGWVDGNNHWSLAATGFIPVGANDPNSISFEGLNRPALDIKAGYTYLDPKIGTEFSGGVGLTFNGTNSFTNYQSGTDLHLEAGIIQHVPVQSTVVHEFQIGAGGYYFQQVSPDGGSGDRLGAFEGRVAALGPIVGSTVMVGETPVTLNARWFHEFDVQNRFKGDEVYLTVTVPLQVYALELAAAAKAQAAAKKSANVYKAPVAAPVDMSWTGFYVGGNAGGVWSNTHVTWTANPAGFPGFAPEIDAAATGNIGSSGFTGGGEFGFNYQVQHAVFGVEGDYGYTGLSGTRNAAAIPAVGPADPITEKFDSNFLATFRTRLGFASGPWLFYATGGVASARVTYSDRINFPALGSFNAASNSLITSGWVAGGGTEWAFGPHWSLKAEYLHVQLDDNSYRSFNSAPPFVIARILHDHSLSEDLARVGLNYRFTPSDIISARY